MRERNTACVVQGAKALGSEARVGANRSGRGGKGPWFIVVEGLDGTGKSTLAKGLSEWLDAVSMTTPSHVLREVRGTVVRGLGESQEARQLFYMATVVAAAREVERHLAEGRSVVMDRYFLSTEAYAAFRGSRLRLDGVQPLLLPADATVVIDVPLEERCRRLQARGCSEADVETMAPEAHERIVREHEARAACAVVGRYVRVEGHPGGPEEVLGRVCRALREALGEGFPEWRERRGGRP